MRLTFRSKLLAGQLVLVGLVMLVVIAQLDHTLALDLQRQLEARLEAQALGAAQWIKQNRHPERLVARLAEVIGADVALFDDGGRLRASSRDDTEPDGPMQELAQATEQGVGRATRPGPDGAMVLHVAVQTEEGVLRLSAPVADINATVMGVRQRLVYSLPLGVLAAVALSVVGAALASRPLRKMTQAAKRIEQGDYAVELPPATPDDFGVLARALASLAEQLRSDMARIQQLERVRRDFIANVSHELRTPVTAIQGYAETLLDGGADDASRTEFLEAIHRHATRLGALVAGLLKLSGLEARAADEVVSEVVDLAAVSELALSAARLKHGSAMPDVAIDLPKPTWVMADPLGVEQVLDNLLDNAIKYGGRGIRIAAERSGEAVTLRVIDDGPGIAKEDLGRVFERFYCADKARSREKGGSGLGLAIAKHLCEAMGGSIRAESAVGRGAEFIVTLRAARLSGAGEAAVTAV